MEIYQIVWVVKHGPRNDSVIDGVFSTEKKTGDYAEAFNTRNEKTLKNYPGYAARIEYWKLDPVYME